MNALQRRLSIFRQNPGWAAGEAAARLRMLIAPRHGSRCGKIGPVRFQFDFDLDRAVRQMYVGAYATEIVRLLRRLLRPGDTFVDVGANIGYLSSVAAGLVGGPGRVLSFEPAPPYFSRLAAVRDLNVSLNWEIFQHGLGSTEGTADLTVSAHNIGWNSLVPGQIPSHLAAERVQVDIKRLDDCLKAAGVERIRVLKIDVEGYEGPVILGAGEYLRQGRIENLIVEVVPGQYPTLGLDFRQVMASLQGYGYHACETRSPHRPLDAAEVTQPSDIWFRRA
jgi:FkbM family methyltransferase